MTDLDFSPTIYFDKVKFAKRHPPDGFVFGEIDLPKGSIAAFDPLAPIEPIEPFTSLVEPGRYSVARFDQGSLVLIMFSPNEAVSWRPALFEKGGGAEIDGEEYRGYIVNSGTGCFVDASAVESLITNLKDNDWLYLLDFLDGCEHLFYVDLTDPEFVRLTSELLDVMRSMGSIAYEDFPISRETTQLGMRQRDDLQFLPQTMEKIRETDPGKSALLEPLNDQRQELIEELTEWTEKRGFCDQMEVALASWQSRPDFRSRAFRNFRIIVLPSGVRAVVFGGFGDDTYPSFWGYDESDKVCQLLTDFGYHRIPNVSDEDDAEETDTSDWITCDECDLLFNPSTNTEPEAARVMAIENGWIIDPKSGVRCPECKEEEPRPINGD